MKTINTEEFFEAANRCCDAMEYGTVFYLRDLGEPVLNGATAQRLFRTAVLDGRMRNIEFIGMSGRAALFAKKSYDTAEIAEELSWYDEMYPDQTDGDCF